MGEKERREGGPGGWRRRGRRGTKGRRVVINGEAIWFLLGDALLPPSLRGIPAVNEFVNGGRETVFRESFARISPSSVSRASTGGLERSRIIYAVVLWQRAPPSFTKNVFLSSQEDFVKSLSLSFFLFFPPQEESNLNLSPPLFFFYGNEAWNSIEFFRDWIWIWSGTKRVENVRSLKRTLVEVYIEINLLTTTLI